MAKSLSLYGTEQQYREALFHKWWPQKTSSALNAATQDIARFTAAKSTNAKDAVANYHLTAFTTASIGAWPWTMVTKGISTPESLLRQYHC